MVTHQKFANGTKIMWILGRAIYKINPTSSTGLTHKGGRSVGSREKRGRELAREYIGTEYKIQQTAVTLKKNYPPVIKILNRKSFLNHE